MEETAHVAARARRVAGLGHSLATEPAKISAIVPLDVRQGEHYVVIRTVLGERIIVADPSYGIYELAAGRFLKSWSSRVAFTIQPVARTSVAHE